jgi:hypothetical protein
MALGFQDCCNGLNFFLLAETPASVSEFEVYSVETQEGPTFCATYVNLPTLNYQPPTYHAISLTQQLSCDDCIAIVPCPTEETIFHSQFGEGSVITTSDCTVTTIRQMQVQCFPTSPTYENSLDGKLDLFINNGTPPYIITDYKTGEVVNAPRIDDFYGVLKNISAGTYNFVVNDFTSDFSIPISCLVTAPPPLPVFGCNTQDATFYDKPDGILDFIVLSAGTPPYRYYFGNSRFQFFPPRLIQGGTYNIRYEDQYYVQYITCTVGEPPEPPWPQRLCMTFSFCGSNFKLGFTRQLNPTKLDYHSWYLCDNPEQVGCERITLYYNEFSPGGWHIEETPIIFPIQFSVPCGIVILNPTFSALKSDITSDLPNGDWKVNGSLASNAVITDTPCGLSLVLIGKQDFVIGGDPTVGKVFLESQGGSGIVQYVVSGDGFSNVTKTTVIESLKPGNYTVYAQDTTGNQSNQVSFTIDNIQPFDFIFNFTPCVVGNYTNTWLIQIPGGSSVRIEEGESRQTTIPTSFYYNFNYLPADSILRARISVIVDGFTVTGPVGYNDPNIVSIIQTIFNTMSSITDGVNFDFMDGVIPTFTTYPLSLNGEWYRVGDGNQCCIDPTNQGVQWKRQITWVSNQITIKNNTVFNTSMETILINSIPFTSSSQPGCVPTYACSGYIDVKVRVTLQNIQVVSGPIFLSQNYKEIYRFVFRTHSNGGAQWISGGSPRPAC